MEGFRMRKHRILLTALLILVLVASCAVASAAYYHISGTTWLKVRQLPYTNAVVLGNYRKDFALTVTKKYGDWSYVHFTDGHEGYVMNKYITSTSSYKAWITADDTALRSGPDSSFASQGTLSKGTKLTVLSHGSSWDYVSTTNGNGYVRNSFLSKKAVAANKSSGGYTAYVANSDTASVNIRSGAGKGYSVIGKAYVGNAVNVISHGKTWDKIEFNGITGYMMTQYLSKKAPSSTPSPAPTFEPAPTAAPFVEYTAYITSSNGKSVNFRRGPGTGYANWKQLPVGTAVTVLEYKNATWAHIKCDGQDGYVMRKYLSTAEVTATPAPSGKPTAEPTPEPTPFSPYYAYVTSSNGKSVNLRNGAGTGYGTLAALPVGTSVYVTGTAAGGWSKVEYADKSGYVMSKFLTTSYVEPTSGPTVTEEPVGDFYPAYVVSTNGEPVNMRSGPGIGYSNVTRLPVGTVVTVLGQTGEWCRIEYEGSKGYMKKQFLSTTAP